MGSGRAQKKNKLRKGDHLKYNRVTAGVSPRQNKINRRAAEIKKNARGGDYRKQRMPVQDGAPFLYNRRRAQ